MKDPELKLFLLQCTHLLRGRQEPAERTLALVCPGRQRISSREPLGETAAPWGTAITLGGTKASKAALRIPTRNTFTSREKNWFVLEII